jgi:uncharacterized membrane protein
MDIAARLAIIPHEIQDIENNRLQLEQILGGIWWPMFLFSVDPGSGYIHNHILHLQNKIRILENRKKALLEEQQSLIVAAAHHGEKNGKR